ncbi:MAG TPA: hypothetical protein VE078_00525 [Thermoanaerobaculia bacterium]|nr:hypothetical protein [Thermoanaerobaculia bacterium]
MNRTFYLGTHHPDWLAKTEVPLFVSRTRLKNRRTVPRAAARWALDSGAFSEISVHGRWTPERCAYTARGPCRTKLLLSRCGDRPGFSCE